MNLFCSESLSHKLGITEIFNQQLLASSDVPKSLNTLMRAEKKRVNNVVTALKWSFIHYKPLHR